VKKSNEVAIVELGGEGRGRGDCSALIACWHRGIQQEGQRESQKQSVIELKKRLLQTGNTASELNK
jgi:hypothetical protein